MNKKIAIIGAGISGLTCLHYLKEKYKNRPDVEITLFEKNDYPGGTIRTEILEDCYFEYGPNGFLDNKPQTLKLVDELGLTDQLISACEESRARFVSIDHKLFPVPTDQDSFMKSKLLNAFDRMRIGLEVTIPKGHDSLESIYDFAKRRFGSRIADVLVDPFVSGVYAGDAKRIVLKATFPKVLELEQEYGSLIKALKKFKDEGQSIFPKATLKTLKNGMGQLIETLTRRYGKEIKLGCEIKSLKKDQHKFSFEINNDDYSADHLIFCTPAYVTAAIVSNIYPELAQKLSKINYAPVAVVGLVYPKEALLEPLEGFGYLIASKEGQEVLGVLFENNIFPKRCSENNILFRVMLGGMHHPKIINLNKHELIQLAKDNLKKNIQIKGEPKASVAHLIGKAIPQYDKDLVLTNEWIRQNISELPIGFVANWHKGVSLNDCIENAYRLTENLKI
jgi:oxygen-dependent protoporphyrinogen oxidase